MNVRFSPNEEAALLIISTILQNEGNVLFSSARYNDAISAYKRALVLCPNNLDYEIALLKSSIAACHMQLEEWKEAVVSADMALKRLRGTDQSSKTRGEAEKRLRARKDDTASKASVDGQPANGPPTASSAVDDLAGNTAVREKLKRRETGCHSNKHCLREDTWLADLREETQVLKPDQDEEVEPKPVFKHPFLHRIMAPVMQKLHEIEVGMGPTTVHPFINKMRALRWRLRNAKMMQPYWPMKPPTRVPKIRWVEEDLAAHRQAAKTRHGIRMSTVYQIQTARFTISQAPSRNEMLREKDLWRKIRARARTGMHAASPSALIVNE